MGSMVEVVKDIRTEVDKAPKLENSTLNSQDYPYGVSSMIM